MMMIYHDDVYYACPCPWLPRRGMQSPSEILYSLNKTLSPLLTLFILNI